VVRIRGLIKIREMAGNAFGGKTLELTHCRALVAVLALHRGVSAEKREAILVIFDLLNGIIPTENRVALRAVRAHFPLVNIGVAILTVLAHVREYRFYVALRALNFLMHAAERISCFIVIKFRNGADGAPASSGVAVFAGNGERSVGTTSRLPLWCGHGSARCGPREEQQAAQDLNGLSRNSLLGFSFRKSDSPERVVVRHHYDKSSWDYRLCAGAITTVPTFSFWPGTI